jgi:hypothetical protein
MLSLLGSLGSMLRNVFALSFAAICGLSSMLLNVQQISDLAGTPPGGGAGAGVDRDGLDRRICDSGLFPARKGQEGTRKIGLTR